MACQADLFVDQGKGAIADKTALDQGSLIEFLALHGRHRIAPEH